MAGRRAFTLIEVIVVTVLMAMLAAVLVTRLSGAASREFDIATEKVSDLMLMYAIRSEFASEPVGITMDPNRNRPGSTPQWTGDQSQMGLDANANGAGSKWGLGWDHMDLDPNGLAPKWSWAHVAPSNKLGTASVKIK